MISLLIYFNVTNYASIKDSMQLSTETGEYLRRLKKTNTLDENGTSLLKSILIFGANGSGKSNLLDALHLMKSMVLNNATKVTDSLKYRPFVLNNKTAMEPVEFKVKFNFKKIVYSYEFSFVTDEIRYEKLSTFKGKKESIYFERNKQDFIVIPENFKENSNLTKPNSLFVYTAQQANDINAINVLKWFQNDLIFVDDQQIPDALLDVINDVEIKEELLNFLNFADFNIVDVQVQEQSIPELPAKLKEMLQVISPETELRTVSKQMYMVHNQYSDDGKVVKRYSLPLALESRGTQKIVLIALSIINAQLNGNGKTLLFDEFDDSLHFELSSALIKIFNSEQNTNQFILTTHELQLLDSKVRTDQIYLLEKDFQGRSTLNSIFDFKDTRDSTRRDVSFMKRYIDGRFGALPQISTEDMLTTLNQIRRNKVGD